MVEAGSFPLCFLICDHLKLQPFLKPDLLDGDIRVYQFQFIGQCYQGLLAGKGNS